MPFINGRFHMNPAYGRALEAARAKDLAKRHDVHPIARQSDLVDRYVEPTGENRLLSSEQDRKLGRKDLAQNSGHWVTIDGHHVLISGTQASQSEMKQPRNENERYLAIVVFNETGGLGAAAENGHGSAKNLHDARVAVAEIANRLRDSGHPEKMATGEGGIYTGLWRGLSQGNKDSIGSWNDSVSAASIALAGSDDTRAAAHFRLDKANGVVPSWAKRTPSKTFGPFRNSGGGDASSRPHIYVYQ